MTIDQIEQEHYTATQIDVLFPELERIYEISTINTATHARAAYLMGFYFEDQDWSVAHEYYDEAFRTASLLGDKKILADSLHGQALAAFRSGDFKLVISLESQAVNLAQEVGHTFRVAASNLILGIIAIQFGSGDSGINHIKNALQLSLEHNFIRIRIRIFWELASLYVLSEEKVTAAKYAEQSLTVAKKIGVVRDIINQTIRLATIELELKKYGEVTKLVAEVRKTLPQENHSLWCVTHTLMGKVHEAKRRYEKAETEFRTALSLADYVNAERVRSNVHVHLAELYLKTKKPKLALKESLAAVADAEKAQDAYVRKEALRSTHECYKALGMYKQAHDYLEQYNALVAESDTALLKSRLEYHALKNDYELEKVKSETQTKKSELLRIKLDYKERELTEKIRHLIKQAEAVRQFRNDLRALVRRTPSDDPSVKDIRARLASFTEEEINWQEFEKEFTEAHPEFLQTLSEKYPELTQMEQRVAAMLRMDLKSADIARLFCITERAVEFHRLNLRKKFRLKKGEELTKFLCSL